MYTLSDFQRYQALQSLPLLSDQRPSELMDKMLILLSEDEKPGFFFCGLFMDRLPANVQAHILSESINDPRGMAQHADELWTIQGRGASVQTLSDDQFDDVNALPQRSSARGFWSRPVVSTQPQTQATGPQIAGTTIDGETMLPSVVHPAPIQETS